MDASSSAPKASNDSFIRPGEEGFESFPKQLPEDCVYCTIHILNTSLTSKSTLRSRLLEILDAANSLKRSLLEGYIWQRESFNLTLWPPLDGDPSRLEKDGNQEGPEPLHLRGKTSFGDSVADEWLIVYMLRELSKTFEDAWIRVWDADGEFLLVEAANTLPKWLNPEVAEYRVWINCGNLKIIPRSIAKTPATKEPSSSKSSSIDPTSRDEMSTAKSHMPQTPRNLTLSYALNYLTTQKAANALLHDSSIETEAFRRIQNYPADIASSMHTSVIFIPRRLAYVLHRCSSHISPAIEAFYLRDSIALKPLRAESPLTALRFPPDDLVEVSVKFTRVGFAQLRGQEFDAPKIWTSAVSDSADDLKTRQRKEIGMKLSCGFEMLMADPANKDNRAVREIELLLGDLEDGEEELPSDKEIEKWDHVNDDEAWLDVDFEAFERELSGKGGGATEAGTAEAFRGFGDKSAQENLRRMVEKFQQLLEEDEAGRVEDSSEDEMDLDDDEDEEYSLDDIEDENNDNDRTDEDGPEFLREDTVPPFNEENFRSMMKQLGLPVDTDIDQAADQRVWEVDSDDETMDAEEIQRAMEHMEAELKELGAFEN